MSLVNLERHFVIGVQQIYEKIYFCWKSHADIKFFLLIPLFSPIFLFVQRLLTCSLVECIVIYLINLMPINNTDFDISCKATMIISVISLFI